MVLPLEAARVSTYLSDMGRQTALSFTALLPLVNPVGSALVLLSMIGDAPEAAYKAVARRVALSTFIFLVVIEVLGDAMLRFFGLSLPVVQLAGGLVVASIGWGILNKLDPAPSPEKTVALPANDSDLSSRVFYPFTFPITAGPGCIVLMLTLSAHASRNNLADDLFSHGGIVIASAILSAMVYFCYAYADRLTRRTSAPTVNGVQRIMGFIVLSIGVQIGWNGLEVLLRDVLGKP